MYVRLAIAFAFAWLAWLTPGLALAGQGARELGADARVRVEPNGNGSVELHLRWTVVHGPLHSVDLVDVDPSAVVDPDVRVSTDDGRVLGAHAIRRDDRSVRVVVDDPRGLARGEFAFDVRWTVDLVATQALVRDGARWRLTWSAPLSADGFDAARTLFELPAAPEPPQPVVADSGAVDESAVATLRREPDDDVLELVRPHVARGEAVAWSLRFDPHGMTQVRDPRLRPPPQADRLPEQDRTRQALIAAALLGLALGMALLVVQKTRAFAAACAARGVRPRALLPLGVGLRAFLAAGSLATAVGLEIADASTAAALLVGLATLAASLQAPAATPVARGPGRWLALRPQDAFVAVPSCSHWLDMGTWAGRAAALVATAVVAAASLAANRFDATCAWLVVLDAAPLVALFATGCSAQLPPRGGPSAACWMAAAFQRLRRIETLRVAPWARLVESAQPGFAADELRLLVLPRAAMPGLVGVELGLAWSSTPVGWTARPEVLARVVDGTPAAAKLVSELPAARLIPGRRPEERVAVLTPRSPTRRGGIALTRAVACALTDRRAAFPPRAWTAPERRTRPVPANERAASKPGTASARAA